MAPRYLLDTNILSDLIRSPQGEAAQRIMIWGQSEPTQVEVIINSVKITKLALWSKTPGTLL